MLAASFFVSPSDLWNAIGTAKAPQIIDGLLRQGFMVYDALFAWLRFAAAERHNWPAKAA